MGKKFWITTGIVATAIGVTAIVAHAERGRDGHGWGGHRGGYEEGGHRGGRHHGGHRRGMGGMRDMTKADFDAQTRARFAEWDANSDGVVDSAEAQAHIAARMEKRLSRRGGQRVERMFERFDADRDGKTTKAEIEAWVAKNFARMDLTGDGKITDEDLPPMMRGRNVLSGGDEADGAWSHSRRGRGGRMIGYLKGADANKDGAVVLDEVQARAARRFGRFDRNGDGVIDAGDRDAMRKEMVDYRVLRFMHRFGASKDGKLTLAQFTQHRDERFANRDRDGDGVIEREERRGGHGHRGRSYRGDDRPDQGGGEGRGNRGGGRE